MKTQTIYTCEACGKHFSRANEAYTCEAQHMCLSLDLYYRYLSLYKDISDRSAGLNAIKGRRSKKVAGLAYERAADSLIAFGLKHKTS